MSRQILLVEDNEDDAFLMTRALKTAGVTNPLAVAEDGQQAIDYLDGTGKYSDRSRFPLPTFVFLDLKLPLKSGHEVLSWIRSQEILDGLVVLVLTSSSETKDIELSYRTGANTYLVKPASTDQLTEMARAFKHYWLDFSRAMPI